MGKRIKLSNGRRLVDDVIHMANKTPLAALSATFDLTDIAKLRRMARPRISWNVLFMKAYAQVCSKHPALMQCYVKFPYRHLYQHHQSVCMMTIAREHKGEERLLFARFNEPDNCTLVELQEQYDLYRKEPVEEIKQFRHQINFAKAPSLVRAFAWWTLFNVWPKKRASHMGTYGMSFSGYKGAFGDRHLGPNTTTIGVDPFPRKGQSQFLYTFDHRVIDGTPASEYLNWTYRLLNNAIRRELASMAGVCPETLEKIDPSEVEPLPMSKKERNEIRERERLANRRGWFSRKGSASKAA